MKTASMKIAYKNSVYERTYMKTACMKTAVM